MSDSDDTPMAGAPWSWVDQTPEVFDADPPTRRIKVWLDPEDLEYVRANGGGAFLLEVLEWYLAKRDDP